MFETQLHQRDAYRALFAFGGTLAALDPTQVSNIPAAILNAHNFTREVVELVKPKTPATLLNAGVQRKDNMSPK